MMVWGHFYDFFDLAIVIVEHIKSRRFGMKKSPKKGHRRVVSKAGSLFGWNEKKNDDVIWQRNLGFERKKIGLF